MLRGRRFGPWRAFAGLVFCLLVQAVHADGLKPDAATFLARTESLRTADHPRFVRMLQQLHRQASSLSPRERWHLRYLDAWQTAFQGDYAKAEGMLRDVIDHSADATLAAKASALLMSSLALNRRYEEAFTLANQLVADLPGIKDTLARFSVLANLSQLLGMAGQNELAAKYARMAEGALPPGETPCIPRSMQITALYNAKKLRSSSPELRQAIDICLAAGQQIPANTLWLVKGSLYLDEGRPAKVLALLDRIAPSIHANPYYSHMLTAQVERAQANWRLGKEENALAAARAAVAMSSPEEISQSLRDAYEVLYRIAKKRGDTAAALSNYEHFVALDKGYLNSVSARSLAYQMVQQHVLAKKLEADALSKQNNILKLQRALDAKAVETGRLYNLLLLGTLASIGLWLLRLKRSQLRFKKLSSQDGLTGISNHQHFIGEADRILRLLEKKLGHACLIAIDLDHFKQVNDTYGHATGDAVLRRTVAACQQQLRPSDLFGRLGGEEFGILLHECSRDQGLEIADRIRTAIADASVRNEECVVSISASIGLASTGVSGYAVQRLCMDADAALYRAKRAGRNRVVPHSGAGSLAEA